MNIHFFEEISSNAHVALNTMLYDGWILRFANGHTNRANSVSVIYPSTLAFDEKVSYCEEVYRKAHLPCVFKLTEKDSQLNKYLKEHGYKMLTPTDVMILNLKETHFQKGACVFSKEPTEEWLRSYFAFEGITDATKQETFRKMLSKVLVDTIYCSFFNDDEMVACASAAIERRYMLLQNVVVCPECRGKGYGQKVCESLLAYTKENDACYSYLQVVKDNVAAVNLYSKLGYKKVYTYWYMKKHF
ncbi:MAG: GNAT family N-acetyltransferase [Treponema sp.]|nr:GNAT family N-acetyltransferase [Treponema sp.]